MTTEIIRTEKPGRLERMKEVMIRHLTGNDLKNITAGTIIGAIGTTSYCLTNYVLAASEVLRNKGYASAINSDNIENSFFIASKVKNFVKKERRWIFDGS